MAKTVNIVAVDDEIAPLNCLGYVFGYQDKIIQSDQSEGVNERIAKLAGKKCFAAVKNKFPNTQFEVHAIHFQPNDTEESIHAQFDEIIKQNHQVIFVIDRNLNHREGGLTGENLMQSYFYSHKHLINQTTTIVYSGDDQNPEHIRRWKIVPNVVDFFPKPLTREIPKNGEASWLHGLRIALDKNAHQEEFLARLSAVAAGKNPKLAKSSAEFSDEILTKRVEESPIGLLKQRSNSDKSSDAKPTIGVQFWETQDIQSKDPESISAAIQNTN